MSARDVFEGKGGQQLLLPRRPFCPGRDCERACSHLDCGCDPCRCERACSHLDCGCDPCRCGCRGRRPKRGRSAPDLLDVFSQAAHQVPLFPTNQLRRSKP